MVGKHPVRLGQKTVGNITVSQKGLYYQFLCQVNIPDSGKYRLYAQADDHREDLGLCVPEREALTVCTQRPVKGFAPGDYEYWLQPEALSVKLRTDSPFPLIKHLRYGSFEMRNGAAVIVFNQPHTHSF